MKILRKRFRPRPLTTRRKITLAALAAVPVLLIFTFGNRGILKRVELEMESDRLYEQLSAERSLGDSLRTEIERMKSDSGVVEQLARERYGMVRSGETIYRVIE
jgi:cell division protein FtsB